MNERILPNMGTSKQVLIQTVSAKVAEGTGYTSLSTIKGHTIVQNRKCNVTVSGGGLKTLDITLCHCCINKNTLSVNLLKTCTLTSHVLHMC